MVVVALKFYALVDAINGKDVPWGLMSQEGAIVKRYVPGRDDWVESPSHWDWLTGNEPGARAITAEAAEMLKASGKLRELSQETVDWIQKH